MLVHLTVLPYANGLSSQRPSYCSKRLNNHVDIKRVELAPIARSHSLRPSTALAILETSSAKPHFIWIYNTPYPASWQGRTGRLPSRHTKGMTYHHTIYGASTTAVCLNSYESVEVSMSQNTKRIVNAFIPTKLLSVPKRNNRLQFQQDEQI